MREDLSYLSDKIIWQKQQVLFYYANQKNRKKISQEKAYSTLTTNVGSLFIIFCKSAQLVSLYYHRLNN